MVMPILSMSFLPMARMLTYGLEKVIQHLSWFECSSKMVGIEPLRNGRGGGGSGRSGGKNGERGKRRSEFIHRLMFVATSVFIDSALSGSF
jgi:hypothetical protein